MPSPGYFNIIEQVDSTNNYAMAKVHAGLASHGMAWFCPDQTAGKGQREKRWESEPGQNIALSVVLEPGKLAAKGQFFLSAITSLACVELFSRFAGEETKIKWPNDLYWRDRKAGGILIENIIQGSVWKFAVLGIGININQVKFNRALKNPVSLKQITGQDFDLIHLGSELYERVMKKIKEAEESTTDHIIAEYNFHLYQINKRVRLKKGSSIFETTIRGVSAGGRLITEAAKEREFGFGEVEWLL